MENVISYVAFLFLGLSLLSLIGAVIEMVMKRSVGYCIVFALLAFLISALMLFFVYTRNVIAVSYGI